MDFPVVVSKAGLYEYLFLSVVNRVKISFKLIGTDRMSLYWARTSAQLAPLFLPGLDSCSIVAWLMLYLFLQQCN